MSNGHPQPLSVTGGADGITAHCDEISAVAGRFGAAAVDTLGSAWTLHGYLVHPALAESAVFDPLGYARFEGELLAALDGLHGLTWVGARCGAVDGELRLAAAAYSGADQLARSLHDEVLGTLRLPAAVIAAGRAVAGGQGLGGATQAALHTDPGALDLIVDELDLPAAASVLAPALPDGRGVAHPLGPDRSAVATTPPRSITDIVRELAHRNDETRHGAIDVRILTLADGSRRVIVDITGTKSWTPLPTGDATSLSTNARALVGDSGAYEQGVLQAMRRAGVRRADEVLIVGHSEGGMVAVTTARDAVRTGEFKVTHVITAGSPIGRTVGEVPRSVQVLALENTRDVVPHLDGTANPDEPNVTTVRAAYGNGSVEDDHSLGDSYVPLAADVSTSDNASLREFIRSARGYLHASSVRTYRFQITRSLR